MSGFSRSAVSNLPDTGTVASTSFGTGETVTITGVNAGDTWVVIGMDATNDDALEGLSLVIEAIDTSGVKVKLDNGAILVDPSSTVSIMQFLDIKGELYVDNAVKLQVTAGGDSEGGSVNIWYLKVN